jgi:hypothetical protein
LKNPPQKGPVEWLKVKALSSNLSTEKKKTSYRHSLMFPFVNSKLLGYSSTSDFFSSLFLISFSYAEGKHLALLTFVLHYLV